VNKNGLDIVRQMRGKGNAGRYEVWHYGGKIIALRRDVQCKSAEVLNGGLQLTPDSLRIRAAFVVAQIASE
jgi:hypothetical protein